MMLKHAHARFLMGLAVAVAAATATARGQEKENSAIVPAPREGGWMQMHQKFLDRAKEGNVDLLFLGDSITQGWNDNAVWKRHYGPRHAANFGIGGDRTQHVLWRIENGEIEGIKPKVAVLMIGTNNIGSNTPEQIAAGIEAIVKRLREKLPETKVLLLGVFPRGAMRAPDQQGAELHPVPGQINERIKEFDDGMHVFYLDIGEKFLRDGKLPRDIMPDFLHLSPEGYRIWAEAMEPKLWLLMEE